MSEGNGRDDVGRDNTGQKHGGGAPNWTHGESGNPKGRPRGARSKLGEGFLEDLRLDWEENGAEVIEQVRQDNPVAYLRVVASILPKALEIGGRTEDPFLNMGRDELGSYIARMEALVAGDED